MDPVSAEAIQKMWTITLVIYFVVVVVVTALLTLILRAARDIRAGVSAIWTVGQQVATGSGSATIWALTWLGVILFLLILGLIAGGIVLFFVLRRRGRAKLNRAVKDAADKARREVQAESREEDREKAEVEA